MKIKLDAEKIINEIKWTWQYLSDKYCYGPNWRYAALWGIINPLLKNDG